MILKLLTLRLQSVYVFLVRYGPLWNNTGSNKYTLLSSVSFIGHQEANISLLGSWKTFMLSFLTTWFGLALLK